MNTNMAASKSIVDTGLQNQTFMCKREGENLADR